jgi:hypothetical protein
MLLVPRWAGDKDSGNMGHEPRSHTFAESEGSHGALALSARSGRCTHGSVLLCGGGSVCTQNTRLPGAVPLFVGLMGSFAAARRDACVCVMQAKPDATVEVKISEDMMDVQFDFFT